MYRFIKKNRITVVHTHSSKASILGRLAARAAGVKIIVHSVHGWPFNDTQPNFKRKFFIALERFAARFTGALIVVSQHDLDVGLSLRIGAIKQYFLIRYGIDAGEFLGRLYNSLKLVGLQTAFLLSLKLSASLMDM